MSKLRTTTGLQPRSLVDVDTAGEWLHWEAGGWWEKAMPMFALHCGHLDGH